MKIKQGDKSTLEVETTDTHTGDGTDTFTISIYNEICNESAYINLSKSEAILLKQELDEWLDNI